MSCNASHAPSEDPCVVDEKYAVFVSPLGTDDGDGSRAHPLAKIGSALTIAHGRSLRVYACATGGVFRESLVIDQPVDGAALYGGFDCANWAYLPNIPTAIQSDAAVGATVANLKIGARIEDVAITASDAKSNGASSFGALVTDATFVLLNRVQLTAGNGAAGEDGVPVLVTAADGLAGADGTEACEAVDSDNPGGRGRCTSCVGGVETCGGDGGNGGRNGANGGDGRPGTLNSGQEVGVGQTDGNDWSCTVGTGHWGKRGADGSRGAGATALGTLTASGYATSDGADGLGGTPGGGGSGGGGAKAPPSCGNNTTRTGASGGAGGSGGCGGKGGAGGKGGGASIALASINTLVTLANCTLIAQSGGSGGRGAQGQIGGDGGRGGSPATGPASDSCAGAAGGPGGNGGPGGGGAGGPSIGIAFVGVSPVQNATVIHVPSNGASGGADGARDQGGPGAGANGVTALTRAF